MTDRNEHDALTLEVLECLPEDRHDLLLHILIMRAKALGIDSISAANAADRERAA